MGIASPSHHHTEWWPQRRYIFHHWQYLSLSQTLSSSWQGMIGKLSDNILLTTFRYYLNSSPRNWPRLVHICCRWWHIVFASQCSLHLQLFCMSGTPVLETIYLWPTMPIVIEYGEFPAVLVIPHTFPRPCELFSMLQPKPKSNQN